jgi:hypothetical protein
VLVVMIAHGAAARVYTLLDALAVCQALLLNWHLVRKLGNWKQVRSLRPALWRLLVSRGGCKSHVDMSATTTVALATKRKHPHCGRERSHVTGGAPSCAPPVEYHFIQYCKHASELPQQLSGDCSTASSQ